jgi:nitroreductase
MILNYKSNKGVVCKMGFYNTVRTRRSVRNYKPDPISQDSLNGVLEAVRVAPSGSNRQPWRFIVVKDKAVKEKLAEACHEQLWIAEAPVVVVACGRTLNYDRGEYMGDLSMLVDVAIAFTHMILAARAEGLGTCWLGSFSNEEVKKLLGVPEQDWNVVAVSPLGYPKDGEKAFTESKDRKPLSEIVSTDKF